MDLIYMTSDKHDIGVLQEYELDLAFGSGENNFELSVTANNAVLEAGEYIYFEDTEYGGIIDAIESDTGNAEVTYSGRTWHGILNSKVIQPDAGQDYLVLNGEANTVLGQLITRMGLTSLFEASSAQSGITISNYKMDRYIKGYSGIVKMLTKFESKLHMVFTDGKAVVSALPIVNHAQDAIDNDQIALTVKKTSKTVNHLICLGQGELAARTVVHLYADASGNISQTQTFTGADEYTDTYENTSAEDAQELISDGTDRFKELLQQDKLAVDFDSDDDPYDIGDIVGAMDNITGVRVSVPITKKIVKVQDGILTIDLDIDQSQATTSSSGSGGSGGGISLPLSIDNGGTGAQDASTALSNLGALPASGGTITGNLLVNGGGNIAKAEVDASADIDAEYNSTMYHTNNATLGTFPEGTVQKYGAGITMPYRKPHGNTKPDYAGQIWIPNGDSTKFANDMFFRAGLANGWKPWKRVLTMDTISVANGNTGSLQIENNEKGVVFVVGAGGNNAAEIVLFNANTSGGIALTEVRGTSLLTISRTTNQLIIQNGSGYTIYAFKISFIP